MHAHVTTTATFSSLLLAAQRKPMITWLKKKKEGQSFFYHNIGIDVFMAWNLEVCKSEFFAVKENDTT